MTGTDDVGAPHPNPPRSTWAGWPEMLSRWMLYHTADLQAHLCAEQQAHRDVRCSIMWAWADVLCSFTIVVSTAWLTACCSGIRLTLWSICMIHRGNACKRQNICSIKINIFPPISVFVFGLFNYINLIWLWKNYEKCLWFSLYGIKSLHSKGWNVLYSQ